MFLSLLLLAATQLTHSPLLRLVYGGASVDLPACAEGKGLVGCYTRNPDETVTVSMADGVGATLPLGVDVYFLPSDDQAGGHKNDPAKEDEGYCPIKGQVKTFQTDKGVLILYCNEVDKPWREARPESGISTTCPDNTWCVTTVPSGAPGPTTLLPFSTQTLELHTNEVDAWQFAHPKPISSADPKEIRQ